MATILRSPRHATLTVALGLLFAATGIIRDAAASPSSGLCLRDAAGISQANICTAMDVRIAKFDVLGTCSSSGAHNGAVCVVGSASDPCVVEHGTCVGVQACSAGQQITVPIRATVTGGAKERYDIGFYIAQDGGNAMGNPMTIPHGGVCLRDYLHPASTTNNDLNLMGGHGPYYNAEIGVTPTDTCADLAQSQTVVYDLGSVLMTCRDDDRNGVLDVGTCLSWDINKQTTCNSEADTIPSSSSKCRCESIAVGQVLVCGDGIVSSPEQCDEGPNNGTAGSCCTADCKFKSSGTTCRAAAGTCDVPESCTGTSSTCPGDVLKASGTLCRAAAGVCDVPESCTGSSAACPADGKSTAPCRSAAGDCDVAESCNGSSNDCPGDAFKPSTTQCRAAAGVCDLGENCTGSTATCPADAKSTAVCRPAAGACDLAESCDGASNDCPADGFRPASTVCRAAAGECDVPDSCTGSSAACPADAKSAAGTACTPDTNPCTLDQCDGASTACQHPAGNAGVVCRASAGDCDVAETCTGTNTSCPADGFESSTTVCRPAAGPCDAAESCTGSSAGCPADGKSTAVCRAAAGACDVAESCDGVGNDCPADRFAAPDSVCRSSAGACDPAESCTGASAACPADAKSTAVCRQAAGVCDVAEHCDGVGNDCPADGFLPSSTVCRPAAGACDVAESCTGSDAACPGDAKSTTVCRPTAGDCDVAESCDGTGNDCPSDGFLPSSVVCRAAAGACDVAESCTGTSASCPADGKSTAVCRDAADVCDVAERCDGVGSDCPADGFAAPDTVCRPSAGACDPAESCTGSGAACPGDAKSTAVCRPAAADCDVAESCDGEGNDCPADAFVPSSMVCRPSAGACDPAESCTGTSAACPPDAKSTAECRPAAGSCDFAENCDGASNDCPADVYKSSSTVCRPSAGECDPAENCTGSSAACPADAKSPAATPCSTDANPCTVDQCNGTSDACQHPAGNAGDVCRPSAGACDPAENCTGTGTACPADAKSTALCRPAAGDCDVDETCDGSSNDCPGDGFKASSVTCRASMGACDPAESCTGTSATCPADGKSTAVCRQAAGVCDVAESCDGSSNDCPGDAFRSSTVVCRASAGVCDLAESCTGSGAACPADAKSTATCRQAVNGCDATERCNGTSNDCPADVSQPDGTPCTDTDNLSCTTAGCQTGQCNQRYQDTCVCGVGVTKTGCVVPSAGADCQGHVVRMKLRYTGQSCAATHDAQGAGKVTCTDSGVLAGAVRILVTAANDATRIYANVSSVSIGGTVTADAAAAGATTVATSTRVKIFSSSNTLLQEIVYDTSCAQPLNLGDQLGSLLLVGLKTDAVDVSYDPTQCNAALPVIPSPPNCLGKIAVLRLRYDGGGCVAMQHSQTAGKFSCSQIVNTPFATPVRLRVTDGAGSIVWLDTGAPASVDFGDVVDVIAASVAGKTTLANDTLVNVIDAGGTLLEQMKFKTDCSQPVNFGDEFGGLTVFGMRTTNGGAGALGAGVNYTYLLSNPGPIDASNLTVVDDKLGTVPGSPVASLPVNSSVTLSAARNLATTTVNTVTVDSGDGRCHAEAHTAVVAPCFLGYPYSSSEPRTSILFNESGVLRAFQPAIAVPGNRLKVFYNDEHALTLGVRRVIVKSSSGTTTTDYPVSPMPGNPGAVGNPDVGTMDMDGEQAGTDTSACSVPDHCDRPMFPALFLTDVTYDRSSRSGDWQQGGMPIKPNAVYGSWKAAVKTVDKTKNPAVITVTPDVDPAKNDWNLGSSPDPVPAGLADEGWGAEVVWNVDSLPLMPGHVYRVQVMVHDGDQNNTGGDAGESCATIFIN